MNNCREVVRKYWPVIVICAFSFLLRMIFYKSHLLGWDSAVYLMMGKSLVTGGAVGFIEAFRPLPWSFFLGWLWKAGLDPIVYGTLAEIILTIGIIILVYLIGKKIFNPVVGLAAAILLSSSSAFFFWGHSLYTDIPASFLGLLAVYLFTKERFLLAGGIGAFASFLKFSQVIPVMTWVVVSGWKPGRKKTFFQIAKFMAGFFTVTIMFLVLNNALYQHPLYPFYAASEIYNQVPHVWYREVGYCVKMLFKIEGWIFIFAPFSLVVIKKRNWQQIGMLGVATVTLIAVMKLPTYYDLPRFFILTLPYLYILSAYGIVEVFVWLKKRSVSLSCIFFVMIAIYTTLQFHRLTQIPFRQDNLESLRIFLVKNENNIHGPIWISNPGIVAVTDLKIDELMYYPVFDFNKASRLLERLPEAGYIILDSRALACRPKNDRACEDAKQLLVKRIKGEFEGQMVVSTGSEDVTIGLFKRRE